MTTKTITIEKTFGSGSTEKTVKKSGPCVVVETHDDVLTLLTEDAAFVPAKDATETEIKRGKFRVVSLINYALDLKCRAGLTNQLNSENVDPDKAAEKMVEQVNKFRASMNLPAITLEQAKAMTAVA